MGGVPPKTKESARQVSLQSWAIYALIYILNGDVIDSWYSIGGISAQFNRLSIVLGIAVTANASLAISYDYELRMHTQRLARSRNSDVGRHQLLSEEHTEIKQHGGNEMGNRALGAKTHYQKRRKRNRTARMAKGAIPHVILSTTPTRAPQLRQKGGDLMGVVPKGTWWQTTRNVEQAPAGAPKGKRKENKERSKTH